MRGMNLAQLGAAATRFLKDNSHNILTGVGVSGTIGTAYLTGKASWQAAKRLSEGPPTDLMSKRELIEAVWDLYVPPVIAGVVTVGSIVAANHVSSKRVAAAYSVLAIAEKGFEEYKQKVVETIGENKEKGIRDAVVQDRVRNNPPDQAIVVGIGEVLCQEGLTGRYFTSSVEKINSAVNEINAKLNREMYASLSDFYYTIGLDYTSNSSTMGWETGRLLELAWFAAMTPDKKPCLVFEYNYTKVL